ncbi:MAG: glycosyltransferase family 4 protein [Nannocystaceae bacterium]
MRVLYLHQYFVPPTGSGGTRSYEMAKRLVARGHDVTVLTSESMFPESMKCGRKAEHWIDGIHVITLPVSYDNAMSNAARIVAFSRFAGRVVFESLLYDADVVFATSTPLTIAVPGLLARLRARCPMVFEVRDLWPELPIAIGALNNRATQLAARALEWVAYHGSAQVVALSPGMADGVAKTGYPRDQITVIPNGCDIAAFEADPGQAARFRRALLPEIDASDPLVVYAGTFGRINDVGWLADVAAKMRTVAPTVRFAIVGSGAEAKAIEQRARAASVLGENLFVRPPIKKSEMPLLLSTAQVSTSLFQPLPEMENNSANKFFDTLAAGRPIALNYGGWQADLVRESGAGIVMPQSDAAAAAEQLGALATAEVRCARAGEAALSLAKQSFHRDALADALEATLLRAADPHGGHQPMETAA